MKLQTPIRGWIATSRQYRVANHTCTSNRGFIQRARNRGFTLYCQPNEKGKEFQGTLIRQGTDAEGCQ